MYPLFKVYNVLQLRQYRYEVYMCTYCCYCVVPLVLFYLVRLAFFLGYSSKSRVTGAFIPRYHALARFSAVNVITTFNISPSPFVVCSSMLDCLLTGFISKSRLLLLLLLALPLIGSISQYVCTARRGRACPKRPKTKNKVSGETKKPECQTPNAKGQTRTYKKKCGQQQ